MAMGVHSVFPLCVKFFTFATRVKGLANDAKMILKSFSYLFAKMRGLDLTIYRSNGHNVTIQCFCQTETFQFATSTTCPKYKKKQWSHCSRAQSMGA